MGIDDLEGFLRRLGRREALFDPFESGSDLARPMCDGIDGSLVNDGPHDVDQLADLVSLLDLMTHRAIVMDRVAISSPDLGSLDVASDFELVDQGRYRTIGDANELSQVAQSQVWVAGETDEDVAVIRQERPGK